MLSTLFRVACADFRLSEVSTPQPTPSSELSIVQRALKRRKAVKRSRIDTSTLEMLMFLMYNKDMRDINTIEAVRK
ncbi:hypothetical protein PHMEG_00014087 [Phytophthora megakarya]|uniref:Uncharacterized protein n=1 Tax=Phytophthora megakarya TaxID=4795 RepID=A0A225W4N9_9STRA|nr:hypothetical protein PHMEG_00014087 [Phytophthora megakarya]